MNNSYITMSLARTTFIICIICATISKGQENEFLQQYQAAKQKGSTDLDILFDDPTGKYADIAHFYSLKSQHLWNQANQNSIVISTKPADKNDFALTDPQTGKKVGSISSGKTRAPDPKLVNQAIDVIKLAIKQFPNRIDFPIGLADIYHHTGDYDAVFTTYQSLCNYAKANPKKKFFGRKSNSGKIYEVIEIDPKQSIPDAMQSQTTLFWRFENEIGDSNMKKMADLSTKHFPDRPQAWNMLAAYYSFKKQPDKAEQSLERALQAAPNDPIVLTNLARFAEGKDKKEKAISYYKKIIKSTKSPHEKTKANEAIQRLSKSKGE